VLYQQFEEAGTDLAQALTAKDAIAKKKAAMAPDVAKVRLLRLLFVIGEEGGFNSREGERTHEAWRAQKQDTRTQHNTT
jgi:16S rRNA U1498 N3-methylase RsmE